MSNKKQQGGVVQIGASSLMVVFLVLCLVIFATLSLVSAENDASFSERSAARRTAYYNARSEVELVLDEIDARLSEKGSEASFSDLNVEKNGDIMYFSTTLSDSQEIRVELRYTPEGEHNYEIISYQIVTTAQSGSTEPLQLMKTGVD